MEPSSLANGCAAADSEVEANYTIASSQHASLVLSPTAGKFVCSPACDGTSCRGHGSRRGSGVEQGRATVRHSQHRTANIRALLDTVARVFNQGETDSNGISEQLGENLNFGGELCLGHKVGGLECDQVTTSSAHTNERIGDSQMPQNQITCGWRPKESNCKNIPHKPDMP